MDTSPLTKGASGRGHLRFAWLELTHACNLRCAQCYTHSTPDTPHRSLPTARWIELLDEIAAAGGVAVQLTGGEATLHPDWRALIEHAGARGLHVELFTNGSTLQEDDLDFLARQGVSLAISLHSHRPAVHDRVTGVEGSFVATLQTIQAACARGLHLRVATVLMEENQGDAISVERLMRRQGVLTPLRVDPVRPTGRGRTATSPRPGDAAACTACRVGAHAAMHGPSGNRAQATCWDGKIAIDPEGNLTPCIFSRQAPMGNVATTPLPRVLAEGPLAEAWALTVDDVEACRACDRKAACFDCRALALTVLGDMKAKNPRCDYQPPARASAAAPDLASPRRAPGLLVLPCGDGQVLLDRSRQRVHGLNESATRLIEHIEHEGGLSALADQIVAETEAPAAQVLADLEGARASMISAGILVDGAVPVAPPGAGRWPGAEPSAPSVVIEGDGAPAKLGPGDGGGAVPRMGDEQGEVRLVSLRLLEGQVFLETSALAWEILAPLFAPLATSETEREICGWMQVQTRRPDPSVPWRHYLLVDGQPAGDTFSQSGLRSLVEGALCALAEAGQARDDGALLHAAAISGPAGGVLMPAPSGAGKSVLCVHAVAAGAEYLSDELVRWCPETGAIQGLLKPVTIKGEGAYLLPPSLQAGLSAIDPLDEDRLRWLHLPGPGPGAGLGIAAVVIPDRHPDAVEGLQPIASAEGAAALLQSRLDLFGADLDVLRHMVEACAQLPAFVLGTRDLPGAGRALAALVARGPGG